MLDLYFTLISRIFPWFYLINLPLIYFKKLCSFIFNFPAHLLFRVFLIKSYFYFMAAFSSVFFWGQWESIYSFMVFVLWASLFSLYVCSFVYLWVSSFQLTIFLREALLRWDGSFWWCSFSVKWQSQSFYWGTQIKYESVFSKVLFSSCQITFESTSWMCVGWMVRLDQELVRWNYVWLPGFW